MNAYTVSKLARDAGLSIHVVRNYTQQGLLQPARCTTYGYRIYDETALNRLHFIRAARAAGISLDALANICRALDEKDRRRLARCTAQVRRKIGETYAALATFEAALAALYPRGTRKKDTAHAQVDMANSRREGLSLSLPSHPLSGDRGTIKSHPA